MRYENPMIKNQYFGVEVEFFGMTRFEAAQVLSKYFGNPIKHNPTKGYDNRYVEDAAGRKWYIVSDSSIQPIFGRDHNGPDQCEFVTPKLRYEDMETLQEIIRKIREAGGKTNPSCGIHVHVDAANHNPQTLKNLIYTMKSKEDVLFRALEVNPSRVYRWCQKVEDHVFDKVKAAKVLTMDDLKKIWYDGATWDSERHYSQTRYHALNLHNVWFRGTVEFRLFNGTLHAGKIRAYVSLALALSANAITSKNVQYKAPDWKRNEQELFDWYLIRIGLVGKEFDNVRKHLRNGLPTANAEVA